MAAKNDEELVGNFLLSLLEGILQLHAVASDIPICQTCNVPVPCKTMDLVMRVYHESGA
jgi:hypothetical protein